MINNEKSRKFMWNELDQDRKERYKKLITNFASLSEAFAQKADSSDEIVAPIINSKYQEASFKDAFKGKVEDIGNTSFDASLETNKGQKFLVGIKSFGLNAGSQKIAQYKAASGRQEWSEIVGRLKGRAVEKMTADDLFRLNRDDYYKLAELIAKERNRRIRSSRATLIGLKDDFNKPIPAYYHFLMPSKKNTFPEISVGETKYLEIDIDSIEIIKCTGWKSPANFQFQDKNHTYSYNDGDHVLLMNFKNQDNVIEVWPVQYIDDAFNFFENLSDYYHKRIDPIKMSVSWLIYNTSGEMEKSSGFNAWNAMSKASYITREKLVKEIRNLLQNKYPKKVKSLMNELSSFYSFNRSNKVKFNVEKRNKWLEHIHKLEDPAIIRLAEKMTYRSDYELYIPVRKAKRFNTKYPDFFGKGIGKIGNNGKLIQSAKDRQFDIEFKPSGVCMTAFLTQENGKGIESVKKQKTMGKWILNGIFQLNKYEPLTRKRLDELDINGIRMTKYKDTSKPIELEFVSLNPESLPNDYIDKLL